MSLVECTAHAGLHLNEDHFLAEIIDPQTEEPVAPGERGELVITTLAKEALPILRYRTGRHYPADHRAVRLRPQPWPAWSASAAAPTT